MFLWSASQGLHCMDIVRPLIWWVLAASNPTNLASSLNWKCNKTWQFVDFFLWNTTIQPPKKNLLASWTKSSRSITKAKCFASSLTPTSGEIKKTNAQNCPTWWWPFGHQEAVQTNGRSLLGHWPPAGFSGGKGSHTLWSLKMVGRLESVGWKMVWPLTSFGLLADSFFL